MLMAAIIAWAIAQVLKIIIELIRGEKFDLTRFVGSGGMPSSHTSFTVALCLSIGRHTGWDSAVFALAACFAIVTMYDAANVRREAGQHAEILNYMMDHWKNAPQLFENDLKELLGHTYPEVLGGIIVGVGVGLLV